MRQKIIAGNWKLNPSSSKEAKELTIQIKEKIDSKELKKVVVIVSPPAIYLTQIKELTENSKIKTGAQNCYFEEKGAFTGELSVAMLKDTGIEYVILGHSERRTIFGETDEMVNKKTHAALKKGLIPIVCVGETLKERESGSTDAVVISQLQKSLKDISSNGKNLIIAYEPVWAIGTGETCSSEEANRVCGLIREELGRILGLSVAVETHILYGGSVKPSTITEQMKQSQIDGALIGGASLVADDFVEIIEKTLAVVES
ncbi:MAG: triose-phosphate isomerase [Candidatus Caenarcaniphilales bacterium]|nr:triose-phosphate isomerase [Candidatus Caenarcaniphilales bacterium]